MSFSGSRNLQELAARVHPLYGVFFTSLLYLTIGPFFASPRTGTVAFEIGISSFVSESSQQLALFIFTLLFFLVVLFFSLKPGQLVDTIGKNVGAWVSFFDCDLISNRFRQSDG